MNEAALSVFCQGSSEPLTLIRQKLIVSERMGAVPSDTPIVPLQRDLESQQKTLRLKPDLEMKVIDLDLRKANDLARSHLLHRLMLLDIPWGVPEQSQVRAAGTFRILALAGSQIYGWRHWRKCMGQHRVTLLLSISGSYGSCADLPALTRLLMVCCWRMCRMRRVMS
jgi:hypothetical protein